MRARKSGRILITGSIAGFMPGTFQAVYNGTKAFIDSFSFALRAELKDTGVTVTCLMPGATETEFFERADMMDTKVGQSKKDDPADVAKIGFNAMMKGDGDVVSGWQNKLQVGDRDDHARWRARRNASRHGGAGLRGEEVMDAVIEHPSRWATAIGGAALVVWGARKLTARAASGRRLLATTGAGLHLALDAKRHTRAPRRCARHSVEESVAINRPAEELYRFWRHLEELPRVMPELTSVEMIGHRRSHWVAQRAGRLAARMGRGDHQRDPERVDRLAHRSKARACVSAGSVHFEPRPRRTAAPSSASGCSTTRPAASSAPRCAWAFGEEPAQRHPRRLRRFKQLMETGEIRRPKDSREVRDEGAGLARQERRARRAACPIRRSSIRATRSSRSRRPRSAARICTSTTATSRR